MPEPPVFTTRAHFNGSLLSLFGRCDCNDQFLSDTGKKMSELVVKTVAPVLLSAALVLSTSQASAEPVSVVMSLSSEYSDNIRQTSEKQDDIVHTATVGASYRNQEGMLDHTFDGLLGFETYQNNTYGNDLTVDLSWLGLLNLIPQRLIWRFSENLRDTRQSSLRPNTPDNRERVNFFSTGPTYILPITNADRLQFNANYARTDYEESSQIDTYRYGGSVAWHHLTPSLLNVSLTGAVDQVYYENDVELTNRSAALGLSKTHEFLDWRIEGGYAQTEAEQFGGQNEYDGMEGEISLRYQMSTDGQLNLFASHQLTDTSSQFSVLIFDLPFTFSLQQVVRLTVYEAGYSQQLTGRDQLAFSVARRHQEFETTGETEEINGITARWNHQFSPMVSGYLFGTYEYRRYSEFDREDNEREIGIGLKANLYRNLQLEGFVALRDQTSDEGIYDYDEMRIGVKAVYYPRY